MQTPPTPGSRAMATAQPLSRPEQPEPPQAEQLVSQRQGLSIPQVEPGADTPLLDNIHPDRTAMAFDLFQAQTSSQFHSLLCHCHERFQGAEIFIIRHPNDIDDNGLLRDVLIPEASSKTRPQPVPGPLFTGQSTLLIIDCQGMTSAQLAELNELLDKHPRLKSVPISDSCKRIVVVNQEMLAEQGKQHTGKPGGDFWRRVSHSDNSWEVPETSARPSFFQLAWENDHTDSGPVDRFVLDFQQDKEWRRVLFGAPALDENGQVSFQHSVLTKAVCSYQPRGKPIQIVLKGAPDQDLSFINALNQILINGSYRANGTTIDTQFVQFVRADGDQSQQQLNLLKTAVSFQFNYQPDFTNINAANLDEYLGEVAITQGRAVARDNFRAIEGINITSALSLEQWQRLLKRIYGLRQGSDPMTICLLPTVSQPDEIGPGSTDTPVQPPDIHIEIPLHVEVLSFEDEEEQTLLLRESLQRDESLQRVESLQRDAGNAKIHEVIIEPDTTLASLVGQLEVNSLLERTFTAQDSAFINALERGQPVLLRNLYSNLTLQRQLEGLLQNPPALIINGQRRTFANAQIYITQPNGAHWHSSLWKIVLPNPKTLTDREKQRNILKRLERLHSPRISAAHTPLNQIESFLSTLQSIPLSPQKVWPFPAPAFSNRVMTKLAREAVRLSSKDGSCHCQITHWRQALETIVLGEYRGCTNVFNFIRAMLEQCFPSPAAPSGQHQEARWLDQKALHHFLEQHNYRVDAETIRQNFWTLLQSVAPSLQPAPVPRNFTGPDQHSIELLAKYLLASCPEGKRPSLLKTLQLDQWDFDPETLAEPPEPMDLSTADTEQWQRQRQDQLVEMVQHHPLVILKGPAGAGKTYTAREAALAVNPESPPVVISAGPQVSQETLMKRQQVTQFLTLSPENLARLQQHLSPKELALIKKLADPQAFETMAMDHNGADQTPTISLTAEVLHSLSQQLPSPRWPNMERTLHTLCDSRTETIDGPILQWAKTQSTNGKPVTLIVDEANLIQPGFWHLFEDLNGNPPAIYHGGEKLLLSPLHRVILTGNPDNAPGRNTPAWLRELGVTLYFEGWTDQQLRDAILLPRLASMAKLQGLREVDHHRCADRIQQLIRQLTTLRPECEYSPRDIHELCDRIALALDDVDHGSEPDLGQIIWQACRETFAGTLSAHDPALISLEIWFQKHHRADSPSSNLLPPSQFDHFYRSLTSDREFTFAGASIESLARQYWSAIRKVQHEQQTETVLTGRHSTLVQGPPGRGKDELLTRMLTQAKTRLKLKGEPIHLNGGVSSWESVQEALLLAAQEGRIIIISELNLLPSQFLEQELNTLLTGKAAPGFYLFATVNPTEFSGRQLLSPALASRFNRCQIGDYTDTELNSIARNALPDKPQQAQQLVDWHCNLRHAMVNKGLTQVVPSTSDLIAALHTAGQYPLSKVGLNNLFNRQYRAYLNMAECPWETLEQQQPIRQQQIAEQLVQQQARRQLLTRLYHIFPNIPPITLDSGGDNAFDANTGELTLTLPLEHQDALQSAVLTLVNSTWEQQLPKVYPAHHDTLAKALYLRWKQAFLQGQLDTYPGLEPFRAALVNQCSLDDAAQRTLLRHENQPFITAIQTVLAESDYQASPVTFRRFMQQLCEPLAEPELLASAEQPTDATETPAKVGWTPEPVVNLPTFDAEGQNRLFVVPRIFASLDNEHNRVSIYQPKTTNILEGCNNDFGPLGYNDISVAPLTDEVVQTPAQIYGEMILEQGNATGGWHTLYGITDYPQARLTHLTMTPACPFTLLQDRSTGLYLIRPQPIAPCPKFQIRMIYDTSDDGLATKLPNLSFSNWTHCPQELAEPINNCQQLAPLRAALQQATSVKRQLNIIDNFLRRQFQVQSLDLSQCSPAQAIQTLLTENHCHIRSRALTFWLLARYCGIPVRIINLNGGRQTLEVSENGGLTWKPYLAGGYALNPDKITENKKPEDFVRPQERQLPNFYLWGERFDEQSEACTPENVRYYMDNIPPSHGSYDKFSEAIHRLIGKTASRDGAVSVERIKVWLAAYREWLAVYDTPDWQEHFFAYTARDILHELSRASYENPEAELVRLELMRHFITLGLRASELGEPLQQMLASYREDMRRVQALEQARDNYYSQLLSRPLEPGRDFHWPDQKHQIWDCTTLDQETLSAVRHSLASAHSETLTTLLYGEVPGVQYRSTPPGVIDPVRLIRGRPFFQMPDKMIAPRQAMITVPILPSRCSKLITARLKAAAHNPEVDCSRLDQESIPTVYLVRASEVFARTLTPYIRTAFMEYLYRSCCSHGRELKILFPTEQSRERSRRGDYAYYPTTAGWMIPRHLEDFQHIAEIGGYGFASNDNKLLDRALVVRGHKQGDLCVPSEDDRERCLASWLDSINWHQLVERFKNEPYIRMTLAQEDQKRKEKAERSRRNSTAIVAQLREELGSAADQDSRVQLHIRSSQMEGGVIDDLI